LQLKWLILTINVVLTFGKLFQLQWHCWYVFNFFGLKLKKIFFDYKKYFATIFIVLNYVLQSRCGWERSCKRRDFLLVNKSFKINRKTMIVCEYKPSSSTFLGHHHFMNIGVVTNLSFNNWNASPQKVC